MYIGEPGQPVQEWILFPASQEEEGPAGPRLSGIEQGDRSRSPWMVPAQPSTGSSGRGRLGAAIRENRG